VAASDPPAWTRTEHRARTRDLGRRTGSRAGDRSRAPMPEHEAVTPTRFDGAQPPPRVVAQPGNPGVFVLERDLASEPVAGICIYAPPIPGSNGPGSEKPSTDATFA
jgi:hypothetical protein